MSSEVFGQSTQADVGEEVDGEPWVGGVVSGEEAFEGRLQGRVTDTVVQFLETHVLSQFLNSDKGLMQFMIFRVFCLTLWVDVNVDFLSQPIFVYLEENFDENPWGACCFILVEVDAWHGLPGDGVGEKEVTKDSGHIPQLSNFKAVDGGVAVSKYVLEGRMSSM